jgi:hypothetical protein
MYYIIPFELSFYLQVATKIKYYDNLSLVLIIRIQERVLMLGFMFTFSNELSCAILVPNPISRVLVPCESLVHKYPKGDHL